MILRKLQMMYGTHCTVPLVHHATTLDCTSVCMYIQGVKLPIHVDHIASWTNLNLAFPKCAKGLFSK